MARVRNPLLSGEAHGNMGGNLQFRLNRHGAHVYQPQDPRTQNKGAPSAAQTQHRAVYAEALADWRRLSQGRRDSYNTLALSDTRDVSGWNLFLAEAVNSRNQPRERGDLMNLGDQTNIELPIDGRTWEANLIGTGTLSLILPTSGIASASLYLTSSGALFELGTPTGLLWMDGAPKVLKPTTSKTIEIYVRATPTKALISARFYY